MEESKRRQVIVFTHDVVFLLALKQTAELEGVPSVDQHVRRLVNGAGVCREELPWLALKVTDKIGYLKNAWQGIDKKYREGETDVYEREAKELYGFLREAWERAIEEVLLGGIIERFRPSVETQRLTRIADITDEDCNVVRAGMTKTSAWLTGHDHAAAARVPVPGPDELKKDIEALETWIRGVNKRRK